MTGRYLDIDVADALELAEQSASDTQSAATVVRGGRPNRVLLRWVIGPTLSTSCPDHQKPVDTLHRDWAVFQMGIAKRPIGGEAMTHSDAVTFVRPRQKGLLAAGCTDFVPTYAGDALAPEQLRTLNGR